VQTDSDFEESFSQGTADIRYHANFSKRFITKFILLRI